MKINQHRLSNYKGEVDISPTLQCTDLSFQAGNASSEMLFLKCFVSVCFDFNCCAPTGKLHYVLNIMF